MLSFTEREGGRERDGGGREGRERQPARERGRDRVTETELLRKGKREVGEMGERKKRAPPPPKKKPESHGKVTYKWCAPDSVCCLHHCHIQTCLYLWG